MEETLVKRWATTAVTEAMADTRVVFIMGARQVGKSTLVDHMVTGNGWSPVLSLDEKAIRDAATADPTGFVAGLPRPAVLDEVQRAPDVLLAIKAAVDQDKRPGQFLLTGSSNVMTNRRVKDALTGRMETITLWPLAQGEIHCGVRVVDSLFEGKVPDARDCAIGVTELAEAITAGGFPEARLRAGRRLGRWFASYLDASLDRDLKDISDALRLSQMPRLLRLLAAQSAGILTYGHIASQLGLSEKTVRSYIELLETTFLVRRLPGWRPGLAAREIHGPKAYIVDTGLLMHLIGANQSRIGHDDQVTGKAVETFVTMELIKQVDAALIEARCYHYRFDRHEVDLVIESQAGDVVGVEVKASATPQPGDRRGLEVLRDRLGTRFKAGIIAYTGARTIPLGDRLWALPIVSLWQDPR